MLNQLSTLAHFLNPLGAQRVIPPVDKWQPKFCGEMDLVIKANGQWWHEGRQITRQSMIDLFAKVLWLEEGEYYLKTPVEKIKIQVEDVPFLITDVNQVQQEGKNYLYFTSQNQDQIIVDRDHQPFMRAFSQGGKSEIRPYLPIRFGMAGRIERSVFYHLVNWGTLSETEQGVVLQLQSGDLNFDLGICDTDVL